jgi:tetratricopeptide (TPR) repeat protein
MRFALVLAALSLWAQQDDALSRHAAEAAAALRSGDYAMAERENKAVLQIAPNLAEARMNLGISLFLQKKYEPAIEAFAAGLRQKPGMSNAKLFLGISHFDLNEPAKALPFLHDYSVEQPNDFQGRYYLGLAYLSLNRYQDAEHSLLEARRIDPSDVDALYHLAQAYVGEARENPTRRAELGTAYGSTFAKIEAIDPNSYRLAQLRAASYESKGETAKAVGELEALFVHDPHARGLHYTLGCLYLKATQYPKALEQFQAELALNSPEPRTYLQLGHTYIALEMAEQAIACLQKAALVTPANAGSAWVDIGRAYRQMNRPAEALAAYEKAISLGERTSAAYYQLSMEARRTGDIKRAREALAMSQRLRDEDQPLQIPSSN